MIKKTLIMTIQIYIVAIIARFILVWFYKSDNIIFQIVTGILIAYAGFWFCRIILKKNLTEIRIQDIAYKQLLIIILVAIITEKILLRYLFPEFYKLISINNGWLHFIYNMLYKFPFIYSNLYKPCIFKAYRLLNFQTLCIFPCFCPYEPKQGKFLFSADYLIQ